MWQPNLYLIRIAASATVVFGVAWFCSPSPARAECGDYVLANGKVVAAHGNDVDAAQQTAEHRPIVPGRPCNGPMCSNGNLPSPVPVAPVTISPQDLSCLTATDLVSDKDVSIFVGDGGVEVPSVVLAGIFRPPR